MTDTDDLTNRLTFARHDLTVAREAVEFYPHGDAIRFPFSRPWTLSS